MRRPAAVCLFGQPMPERRYRVRAHGVADGQLVALSRWLEASELPPMLRGLRVLFPHAAGYTVTVDVEDAR